MQKMWKILKKVALIFGAFIVLIIILAIVTPSNKPILQADKTEQNQTQQDQAQIQVVDNTDNKEVKNEEKTDPNLVTLNFHDDKSDCSEKFILPFSKETYDEFIKASVSKDTYAYAEMILQGRAMMIDNCAEARIIDRGFGSRRVRLTSDPSITGWVPMEWAK
ncbi:MAG: hypothetical protein NTZ18_03655 [Candidatus Komeilibacteria bacterium]|nr:hypothetical protein [Candidatus Komeilibacteria bacterium]